MDIPERLPMLLGGALEEGLKLKGMPQEECTEEWVLRNSLLYEEILNEYMDTGVDGICVPTERSNSENLKHFNLENHVKRLNYDLIMLTKDSLPNGVLVAGCLSSLNKDDIKFCKTEFFEMFYIFLDQATALANAGIDFFLIENMISLFEARAAVFACKRFGIPVFVTMSANEHGVTSLGSELLLSLICLQELGISGFGFNCEPDLRYIELFENLSHYSKVPLIAKINSSLEGSESDISEFTELLLKNGVEIIECGKGIELNQIKEIRRCIDKFDLHMVNLEKYNGQIVLANDNNAYFLSSESIELSEPIRCSVDMSSEIFEMNESFTGVVTVELLNYDDAMFFCRNAHMLTLPVIFKSESKIALESGLLLFSGRAMIDSDCSLDREELEKLAGKYGAIVY